MSAQSQGLRGRVGGGGGEELEILLSWCKLASTVLLGHLTGTGVQSLGKLRGLLQIEAFVRRFLS